MSADISKMFREIGLQDEEKDFHRFLTRDFSGDLQDQRMSRLTFGVKCSPYLATQVLLQVAEDHSKEYSRAAEIIKHSFYVDDCLVSVNTPEEAISTSNELITKFSLSCMVLRKWRSSSPTLMASIPEALREADNSTLAISPVDYMSKFYLSGFLYPHGSGLCLEWLLCGAGLAQHGSLAADDICS